MSIIMVNANLLLLLLLLLQEMLDFCGDKGIAPMVQVMKLSEVSSVQHFKCLARPQLVQHSVQPACNCPTLGAWHLSACMPRAVEWVALLLFLAIVCCTQHVRHGDFARPKAISTYNIIGGAAKGIESVLHSAQSLPVGIRIALGLETLSLPQDTFRVGLHPA